MSPVRWLSRLAAPGARLGALGEGYGVWPRGDRRRRPACRISADAFARARMDGLIEPDGQDWRISEAGLARLKRERAAAAPDFGAQHREIRPQAVFDQDGRERMLPVNIAGSPLIRYARAASSGGAPALDPVHVAAGERLRADYHRSTLSGPAVSDWTRVAAGRGCRGRGDPDDAPAFRLAAKDRVMNALEVAGPGLDRLLVNVCLRELGMERSERVLSWPARSGLPVLRMALERLAVHYGMKAPERVANPFRADEKV